MALGIITSQSSFKPPLSCSTKSRKRTLLNFPLMRSVRALTFALVKRSQRYKPFSNSSNSAARRFSCFSSSPIRRCWFSAIVSCICLSRSSRMASSVALILASTAPTASVVHFPSSAIFASISAIWAVKRAYCSVLSYGVGVIRFSARRSALISAAFCRLSAVSFFCCRSAISVASASITVLLASVLPLRLISSSFLLLRRLNSSRIASTLSSGSLWLQVGQMVWLSSQVSLLILSYSSSSPFRRISMRAFSAVLRSMSILASSALRRSSLASRLEAFSVRVAFAADYPFELPFGLRVCFVPFCVCDFASQVSAGFFSYKVLVMHPVFPPFSFRKVKAGSSPRRRRLSIRL